MKKKDKTHSPLNSVICGSDPCELWLHTQAYSGSDTARVAGIFNEGAPPPEGVSAPGAQSEYAGFEEILNDKSAGIIEILASCADRVERAAAALDAGRHVLLAPPFGDSAEDAARLLGKAKRSGARLMSYDNSRFFPPAQKLLRIVRKKKAGTISNMRMRCLIAGRGGWDDYLNPGFTPPAGAAAPDPDAMLYRELCDKFAFACAALGPVDEVFTFQRTAPSGGRVAVVTWKHSRPGVYSSMDYTYAPDMTIRSAYYPRDDNMELTGSSGIIWLTLACSQLRKEPTLRVYRGENQFAYGNLDDDWLSGYRRCAGHFAESILNGRRPAIDPKTSARAAEYARAALESARTGDRIKF